jgi:hypothetical protein
MLDESCAFLVLSSCLSLRDKADGQLGADNDCKDLVWMAVDGISRVFEMHVRSLFLPSFPLLASPLSSQGPTPRNDFCRIFTQEGMLEPLSAALLNTCGDDDDLAESAKGKIVQILLCFAQSDHKVKEAMAKRTTVVRASLPSLFLLFSFTRQTDLLQLDFLEKVSLKPPPFSPPTSSPSSSRLSKTSRCSLPPFRSFRMPVRSKPSSTSSDALTVERSLPCAFLPFLSPLLYTCILTDYSSHPR